MLVAFGAGVLSFFSPCILPLIPAYISFITGLSTQQISGEVAVRPGGRILGETLLFILGFSFIFVLLGASITYLGSFFSGHRQLLKSIGGVIIIIFGLHIAGVFSIKQLEYEKKLHLSSKPTHLLGSFVVGMVFALGWTPCIGPILASVLALAATRESLTQGILLLSFYSLGLALPFLLTSIFINWFLTAFSKIRRYFRAISIGSGALLVGVGVWLIVF